jgi:hypothetical protein
MAQRHTIAIADSSAGHASANLFRRASAFRFFMPLSLQLAAYTPTFTWKP